MVMVEYACVYIFCSFSGNDQGISKCCETKFIFRKQRWSNQWFISTVILGNLFSLCLVRSSQLSFIHSELHNREWQSFYLHDSTCAACVLLAEISLQSRQMLFPKPYTPFQPSNSDIPFQLCVINELKIFHS